MVSSVVLACCQLSTGAVCQTVRIAVSWLGVPSQMNLVGSKFASLVP